MLTPCLFAAARVDGWTPVCCCLHAAAASAHLLHRLHSTTSIVATMLTRAAASVSRLTASRSGPVVAAAAAAVRPAFAFAAFSSPAHDAAEKMSFVPRTAATPGKTAHIKHFKIYRWNPDTKGERR